MITIKEIADAAGVSTTTVSNVLHGKAGKVSPETQERINKLLADNNYIPRFGLNALTNRGSKMISVLISTPIFVEGTAYEKPFYGNIIGNLENMLRKRGYYIMLFSSKNVQEIMKMTMGWNAEGIISISMPVKYYKQIQKMTQKPMVSIDMDENDDDKIKGCCNITSRDYEGGYRMIKYLADCGVQKVVYLRNTSTGADYRRYQGALFAYKQYFGEDVELELHMLGRTYEERMKAYDSMRRLIGRNTALFFSTDLNAVEAIGYFAGQNIKVPDEISVVGFDDDIYAKLCCPRLTTVRIDVVKKAELAVNTLMRLLDNEEPGESLPEVEAALVIRDSVYKN